MPRFRIDTLFKNPLYYAVFWAILYSASMNIPYYSMLFPENNILVAKASLISFIYALAMFYGFTLIKKISRGLLLHLNWLQI